MMAVRRFLFTLFSLYSYICLCSSQAPTNPDQGVALYHIRFFDGSVDNSTLLENITILNYNSISGLTCSSAAKDSKIGTWYFPDGTEVGGLDSGQPLYVIPRMSGRIDIFPRAGRSLNREGIYTCNIPDEAGIAQILYAGIYTSANYHGQASPRLETPLLLNIETPSFTIPPIFTLTCTSSAFPPTAVTWTLNGVALPDGVSDNFQVLRNAGTSTFDNILRVRDGMGGAYACTVSNDRGKSSMGIELRAPSESPREVMATPVGDNVVEVSWVSPTNSLLYAVTYNNVVVVVEDASATTTSLEGLLIDVTYQITVQAHGDLPGPVSTPVSITLQGPPPPSSVITSAPSSTTIFVSWNEVSGADVIGYAVVYSPVEGSCDGIEGNAVIIEGGATTSHTLEGLEEHVNYSVIVHSRGVQARGLPSNPVNERTTSAVPLPPPGVTALGTPLPDRDFIVSWMPVECRDTNDASINEYIVRFGLTGSDPSRRITRVARNTQLTISEPNMRALVPYEFEVAAVNSMGAGQYSSPVEAVLLEAPGQVNNIHILQDIVSVVITWDPPAEEKGRNFVTEYEVTHRLPLPTGNPIRKTKVMSTSHEINDLIPGLLYEFSVRALIRSLEGKTLKTEQSTNVIGQVLGVIVTLLNSTSVNVTWTRLNSRDINTYRVYFKESEVSKRQLLDRRLDFHGNASFGVIGSLKGGDQYQFEVVAIVIVNGLEREGPMRSEVTPSSLVYIGRSAGLDSRLMAGIIIVVVAFLIILIILFIIAILVWWRNRQGRYVLHKQKGKYELQPKATTTALPPLDFEPYTPVSKPIIQQMPRNITALEGERVSFRPKVSGSPPPTVAWYHNGVMVIPDYAIEVEEDGGLVFVCVELKHAGVYRFTVSNNAGSIQGQVLLNVYSEDDQQKNSIISSYLETRKIPVTEFGGYVEELHANNDSDFKEQFHLLPSGEEGHTTKWGQNLENMKLNRFANIIAYDDNRVKLKPIGNSQVCQQDYINASYINGYFMSKKFIASQGPTESTVVDFWRLIWQQRIATIVMITNLNDGGREKCIKYWPEADSKDYGPFRVFLSGENVFGSYSIRTFHVNFTLKAQKPLKVIQYHFTSWPDHGVPEHVAPMLAFHRKIKAEHKSPLGPMLIHCSAGVGRTGTFIAIDIAIQQASGEDCVDIPAIITNLRKQRMKMVQTQEQYIFIHDAVLENLMCGDTQIPLHNFKRSLQNLHRWNENTGKSGFQSQFHALNLMSPNPEEAVCSSAERNMDRNRYTQYLPLDKYRVMLKAEYPDYIHATYINGYKGRKKFIIAQGPLQNTSTDFWKMVYEQNCGSIVMLSGMVEDDQEVCSKYWPTRGIEKYGGHEVCLLEQTMQDGFLERIYRVTDTESGQPHRVSQFQVINWDQHGVTFNIMAILNIINHVNSLKRSDQSGPIVIHCSDTVTRSAIFCCVANAIECCKVERVVDIFQVVKALRLCKPGAIPHVEQYQIIHDFLLYYIDNMSDFQTL